MKKTILFLKKHLRNTFYSNVWIAFAAGCAAYQTSQLFDLDNFYLPLFVASSTLFVYNFQRLVKINQKPLLYAAGRNNWIYRNKKLLALLTIASAAACVVMHRILEPQDYFLLAIPGFLSVFYAVPFKISPKKTFEAMRSLPYLKLFLISFTWSVSTVFLPAVHAYGFDALLWRETFLLAIEQFLFIAAITIPFDIRDLKFDSPFQKTIPQLFGVSGAIAFAMALLTGSFVCLVFLNQFSLIDAREAWALCIGNVVAGIGIVSTKTSSKELYFTGFLDGTIVIKCVLLLIFKCYV